MRIHGRGIGVVLLAATVTGCGLGEGIETKKAADEAFLSGRLQESIELYEEALRTLPNNAGPIRRPALANLSQAQCAAGDLLGCQHTAQTCVDNYPRYGLCWSALATAEAGLGNLESMRDATDRAFDLSTRDSKVLSTLAVANLIGGDIYRSRELGQLAIAVADVDPIAYSNLALIYALTGDEALVDAQLQRATSEGSREAEVVRTLIAELRTADEAWGYGAARQLVDEDASVPPARPGTVFAPVFHAGGATVGGQSAFMLAADASTVLVTTLHGVSSLVSPTTPARVADAVTHVTVEDRVNGAAVSGVGAILPSSHPEALPIVPSLNFLALEVEPDGLAPLQPSRVQPVVGERVHIPFPVTDEWPALTGVTMSATADMVTVILDTASADALEAPGAPVLNAEGEVVAMLTGWQMVAPLVIVAEAVPIQVVLDDVAAAMANR